MTIITNTFFPDRNIDLILLTHLHGDHFFGIFGLILSMGNLGREEPLTIVGPAGVKKTVLTVLEAQGGFYSYKLHFIELNGEGSIDLGTLTDGLQISAHHLTHRVPAFGFVIEEPMKEGSLDGKKARELGANGKQLGELKSGKDISLEDGTVIKSSDCLGPPTPGRKIVILQDTSNSEKAYKDAQDCDLLIHEATYHSELEEKAIDHGHSTSAMAGKVATDLNAKVLVLTHFSPRYTTHKRNPVEEGAEKKEAEYIEDLVADAAAHTKAPVYAAADFLSFTTTKKKTLFHAPTESPYDVSENDPSYDTLYISANTK